MCCCSACKGAGFFVDESCRSMFNMIPLRSFRHDNVMMRGLESFVCMLGQLNNLAAAVKTKPAMSGIMMHNLHHALSQTQDGNKWLVPPDGQKAPCQHNSKSGEGHPKNSGAFSR